MKIRAQIGKVLNLDKCIGCHTCSVTCKNVWTSREGMEYAWFNNVESKPGIGYPKDWENQKRWNGGWERAPGGSIRPRMCVSGRPYKKIYYNWKSGKSEKCIFCFPRIEAGQPTVCSETCVGRIRYLGVMLYDADRIEAAASTERMEDLYQAQLDLFLDPNDPEVIAQARRDGVPEAWLEAARTSPVYKMAMEWKVAFPLRPRTSDRGRMVTPTPNSCEATPGR